LHENSRFLVKAQSFRSGKKYLLLAPIHNRVAGDPSGDAWRLCLGEEKAEPDEPLGVFRPYPVELMRAYPVGVRVRKPAQ
jgi:hypothetical protein